MLTIKRVLLAQACVCALAVSSLAQEATEGAGRRRAPSEASRPFVVMPAQSLADLERRLRPEAKAEDLIGGGGQQLRVAVQHERNKPAPAAEVHDASDDVYYVLEGAATLTLGGRLEAPREVEPGEWRAARISGGRTVEIRKGDLVVVPRGTPHMRSTVGKDFSMILIKVWAEPLPPAPPAPTNSAPASKAQKP
jgi:mannose-6-phosphate isomerase-like protein (cupin superfamily)